MIAPNKYTGGRHRDWYANRDPAYRTLSVTPVAFALGIVNGFIVSLPIIWNWIDTSEWVTGVEMGAGMLALGVALSIVTTAITTVVVALVFVGAYNLVASRIGGIEVALEP